MSSKSEVSLSGSELWIFRESLGRAIDLLESSATIRAESPDPAQGELEEAFRGRFSAELEESGAISNVDVSREAIDTLSDQVNEVAISLLERLIAYIDRVLAVAPESAA